MKTLSRGAPSGSCIPVPETSGDMGLLPRELSAGSCTLLQDGSEGAQGSMCRKWGTSVQAHTFSGFSITQTINALCTYIIKYIQWKYISVWAPPPQISCVLTSAQEKLAQETKWVQNQPKTHHSMVYPPSCLSQARLCSSSGSLWKNSLMGSEWEKTPQIPSHPENRDVVESQ